MPGRPVWGALAAALFAAAMAGPAPAQAPRLSPDQAMAPAEVEAFVDGVVRQSMARDHTAGVTVSVVQDGKVVLAKGYGFADVARRRPVDPERTLFRVGSISKTFTWILAEEAVNDGRMRLDAPLNDSLPPRLRIPDEGFRQPIRLRDAMTHTSGFEERLFGNLFVRSPAGLTPPEDYLAAHRPRRIWAPGEVSAYSNYAAALSGYAVAHVRGQPWQDLLEQRILTPAGMTHTTGREPYPPRAGLPAPMPPAQARDLSLPYRWTGGGFTAQPFEYVAAYSPAGSISSTATDMARYMNLLLGGGVIDGRTVFGPATAAAIRTPMKAYAGGASVDAGVFQTPQPGGFAGYGHNGATLDFHANLLVVPALRLGVFVAANTEGERVTGDLPYLVVQRFYASPPAPLAPDPALLKQAAAYAGEFAPTRRAFHGLEAFVSAFRDAPVSVAKPGYLMLGPERYAPAGAPGLFRNVDYPTATLQVVMAHGRAEKLMLTAGELWRRDVLHTTATLGLAAGAALLAAAGVLIGLCSPARWRAPQTPAQRWAGRLRGPAAALWVAATAGFVLKLTQALSDNSTIVYGWPGPVLLAASTAALVATALSWAALALTPLAWRGSDGWSAWRKARFTATVLAFSAFGLVLAIQGALQPWNP